MENLDKLVNELRKSPSENGWLEFKHNNCEPDMIGQDISALANSAAYSDKNYAYMIWGIDDKTHEIVGTDFDWGMSKVGNQEIECWLRNLLSKNADFQVNNININNNNVVLLIICRATNQTVTFKKVDYIRVGSYTKKLMDYPSMQAQLWDRIRSTKYEELISKKDLSEMESLNYLDYPSYFDLKQEVIPSTQGAIIHYMIEEDIMLKQDNGLYGITNLGAILFAKRLSDFPNVSRKTIRVIQYGSDNKLQILKEYTGNKGYAVGFMVLMQFLEALLPSVEVIEGALRKKRTAYPIIALREAIANALIHQDFSITGTGPIVEIFKSRIEITNPGTPLVDVKRIIDNPPKSRNEKLASLMRRLKMCEELGSGWDRIAISCELEQLPAPKIVLYEENTKVTLFSEKPFSNISQEDKLWACYLHACVKQVSGEGITNSTMRERFGLKESSSSSVSRLIKDAVHEELIKSIDPNTAPRYKKYIPFWT